MIVKTLRFKDTKEFVHILEGGVMGTSEIPDVLADTASIEALKKYFETYDPEKEVDYDNLEVVEYDLIEVGKVGADIRNKLSAPKGLAELVKEYFDPNNKELQPKIEKHLLESVEATKNAVDYLANLL